MMNKRTLITSIVFTSLHASISFAHHELQNDTGTTVLEIRCVVSPNLKMLRCRIVVPF